MFKKKIVINISEIQNFCDEHLQEKIDQGILQEIGLDPTSPNFKREIAIFRVGLLEGVINGIHMGGGVVEGLN